MIAVRSGDRDNWSNVLVDLPREAREYLLERCVTNYTEASNTLFEKLTKHGVLQLKLHVKTDGQDQNDHFTSFSSSSLPSPPSLFSMTHVTSVKGVEHLDISFSSSHFSILAMFASLSPPPRRPAPSLAHSITSLNASHCEDITDGVVNIISKYFTSLLHLNISACSVTAKGILNISSPETNTRSQLQSLNVSHNVASIEAVYNLKDITSLTALNISCLRQVYSMEEYTNLVWSNLKEFRMGGLVCLESLDIAQTIANSIHSLRSLELGECSLRSSDLEYAMSTAFHGTNAEESELCVEKKSSYTCTPLHLLNLSWCDDLSSKAIFSVLIRSPGIRSLILQKTCILCEHVKLIANACPLLEELNLALCSGMSCIHTRIYIYIYIYTHEVQAMRSCAHHFQLQQCVSSYLQTLAMTQLCHSRIYRTYMSLILRGH